MPTGSEGRGKGEGASEGGAGRQRGPGKIKTKVRGGGAGGEEVDSNRTHLFHFFFSMFEDFKLLNRFYCIVRVALFSLVKNSMILLYCCTLLCVAYCSTAQFCLFSVRGTSYRRRWSISIQSSATYLPTVPLVKTVKSFDALVDGM